MTRHTPTSPEAWLPPAAPRMDTCVPAGVSAAVQSLCARPELAVLAAGVTFTVTTDAVPFRVTDGHTVALGIDASSGELLEPPEAVVRHGLELALWQRLAGNAPAPSVSIALGVLAARCAAVADAQCPATTRVQRRDAALQSLVDWAAGGTAPLESPSAAVAARLASLQGLGVPGDRDWELPRRVIERCSHAAAPVEVLLTSGGDSRLLVDPARGLNHYGCSPRPRPWAVTFASCTATSISHPAYAAAEALRRRLMVAALADDRLAFSREVRAIKHDVAIIYGVESPDQVLLTSSGTDGELYALHLALPEPGDRLLNVVTGPGETGSNVGVAAAGRHFDDTTALGAAVSRGALLQGLKPSTVQMVGVAIRTPQGAARPLDDVESEVSALVEDGIREGRRVLLHVLDTSKTGLVAPGWETVHRLQSRFGTAVDVLVDACQLRLRPETVRTYLDHGCMVLVTGSKFFTGPPFAGALLLPAPLAMRARTVPLLAGLGAYATRHDWTPPLQGEHTALAPGMNLGLALRWRAALWEMAAFHGVPAREIQRVFTAFADTLHRALASRPWLALLPSPPLERVVPDQDPVEPPGWDSLRTIFTFTVNLPTPDGQRPATLDELRGIYAWLNQDLTHALGPGATASECDAVGWCCHIGQPVTVGAGPDERAALRICAGARLVSGVAGDVTLGPDPDARLDRELSDLIRIFAKLDVLRAHKDSIARTLVSAATVPDGPGVTARR